MKENRSPCSTFRVSLDANGAKRCSNSFILTLAPYYRGTAPFMNFSREHVSAYGRSVNPSLGARSCKL
jgi:hypothetical protein